jgi:aminodeoxyfutalosine synthase
MNLSELDTKAGGGEALTFDEARELTTYSDLVRIGMLGEAARKATHGDRVTYGRVCVVSAASAPVDRGDAGEVRIVGSPPTIEDAHERVLAARAIAAGVPLTGFSLGDLLTLAGGDHLALADLASMLADAGLEGLAEVPLDRLGDTENATEVVRAALHGGLRAWRATIDRALPADRLDLIFRADAIQRETGAFKALAPLPRLDTAEAPSTGFDDVRTVTAARLVCRSIPSIQVDWPLYGPKLAQVAIAYGADDIDGVAPVDVSNLGSRRSPREDIERQIRSAFAVPVERNGRFETRRRQLP